MTDAARTPRPWAISAFHEVKGPDGRTVEANGFAMSMAPGERMDIARANAALIVAAVNSYEPHKALIRELAEALTAAKREMWDMARPRWNADDFLRWAVVQQMNAALLKAREVAL